MIKVDLSIVTEEFLENYLNSIDINLIKEKLSDLDINLGVEIENIIIADVDKIEEYKDILGVMSQEKKRVIKKVFDYAKYRQKDCFMNFFKDLDIKSCPFCNNNYIYFYNDENPRKTIATLEHYYPKSKYPHLSLSFYNLIPSCYICNSKFKGTQEHEGNINHPYKHSFHDNAKFITKPIILSNRLEFNIDLNTEDERSKVTINRFKLDEIYKEHNDIAEEIWQKAQYYNESRIDELHKEFYETLGYTKEDIKKMIFCNYLKKEDINKRNHAKLTQDILKQFNLGI